MELGQEGVAGLALGAAGGGGLELGLQCSSVVISSLDVALQDGHNYTLGNWDSGRGWDLPTAL